MAKRGRPKGSTYPDGPYLDRIADALTRNSARSANAAIIQIAKREGIPEHGLEAFRRRLHEKWSAQKEDRMAEARDRQRERVNASIHQVAKSTADSAALMADTIAPIVERQRETAEHIRMAMQPFGENQRALAAQIQEMMRPHRELSARIAEITNQIQPTSNTSRLAVWMRTKSAAAVLLTEGMRPLNVPQPVIPRPFASTHPAGANALVATRLGTTTGK